MKKILSLLMASAILLGMQLPALAAETALAGDVDRSGRVDVGDIMLVKSLIMADEWNAVELAIGDLDESGTLDVADILMIKNMIMNGGGWTVTLPQEQTGSGEDGQPTLPPETGEEPGSGEGSGSGEEPGSGEESGSGEEGSTDVVTGITVIHCNVDSAEIIGTGAAVDGDVLNITAAGEYEIDGSWNGRIVVNVPDTEKVKLTLKGLTATCDYDSVIYVESADKVTIKNQKGYVNTITDADTTVESDTDTRGKAAIYARASLEFSGAGEMVVSSTYKHGISTTKKLTVSNGTLNVTSADAGLKGNNSMVIEGGVIHIDAAGDGIKNEEIEDVEKGFINILAGEINITTQRDGIASVRSCTISGGTINITTTGADTASGTGNQMPGQPGMGGGNRPTRPGQSSGSTGTTTTTDVSSKGIKVGCDEIGTAALLTVTGGIITVDSTGHALHSSGNVHIDDSPVITLTSDQKGIQGHGDVTVAGGVIDILTSTEGIESKGDTYITGGETTIYATDDGVNIGTQGKNLYVSGGVLDVTTSSGDTDGIDSNGGIQVSGGFVIVKGGSSQGGMAGSIDSESYMTVTGGTVIALGGICETPSSSSTTYTARMSNKSFAAGSYRLCDAAGNEMAAFTLTASFRAGWISSDQLTSGGSYTLYRDNSTFASWTQNSKTQNVS